MFPPSALKRSVTNRRGFTLVEVTLALGIVGFSMLVTLGLVSNASQTFGDVRRATVYANIFQYVAGNANLTPYSDLSTPDPNSGLPLPSPVPAQYFDGQVLGFDQEGVLVGMVKPVSNLQTPHNPIVYYAKISVVTSSTKAPSPTPGTISGGNSLRLPGNISSTPSYQTKRVDVTVSDSGVDVSNTTAPGPNARTFHVLVSNLSK